MKDQLDRIESKMDKTIDTVTEMSLTMAKMEVHVDQNTRDLEEHIKRTDIAEDRIERLEKKEQWLMGAVWVIGLLGSLIIASIKLFQ